MRFRSLQTLQEKLSDLSSRWRVFPNTETVGYYEYFTQSVHTPKIESRDIADIKNSTDFNLRKRTLSLFAHELTHWLDHCSTLWGRENLIRLYNAIHARTAEKETDYWRIPSVMAELRRIHFADYYTHIGEAAATANTPWVANFTCGQQFGPDGRMRPDHPIVFTNFSTLQGQRIVRVPSQLHLC